MNDTYPKIKITNTCGTTMTIEFDHFDVGGDEWVETFKLILTFLGFGQQTIDELFNVEEEE